MLVFFPSIGSNGLCPLLLKEMFGSKTYQPSSVLFALYSRACINIQDIQRKKGAKCLIFYFTLLGFLAVLKQTLSRACFTRFYGQLLPSHVNPGGWIFSPFICPLSVYEFSLLYSTYLRSALPFDIACTADRTARILVPPSHRSSMPPPSLLEASTCSPCSIDSPCLSSVPGLLVIPP